MKALFGVTTMLFTLPLLASAQTPNQSRRQAYLFFAPGVSNLSRFAFETTSGTVHIGGGAEGFVYRGLGLSAEIGAVGPWPDFHNSEVGIGSANLSYHFIPRDGKVEPFVTAGYTIVFRAGTWHGTNIGGGVNIWLRDHLALRFELRDNIIGGHGNLVDFRIGVTAR